ncbi:T9SS type A sorting domain-containing protein [Flavobacterium sp. J49]|uniref:T9SS type A sorting domain-containing protein n=1 Tax=Flavobacterium sp. J49 TaxID=2718534 RepID=UPI001593EAF6|nr:T9SS type A sorting domain-containing protein [Flavobacterium sp. J49]MBF6640800.1 T9SS type A sorting domain-containing protein [Flavobacterium sp. J49]NIC02047.1 T9SS type A sorting domain-containing protein [Flavobacterium sp. J49]
MKKITFTFVFFMVACFCKAQIINFPDANFKARLLAAAPGLQIASGTASIPGNLFVKIDTNNDGEIQVSEAQMVTKLWLYNANITSLVGIENFANLSELQIYGNNIPNLDLTSLTQLTNLALAYNHITSLNVAGLSQVQWFSCQGNQLTSLDVTGMTAMSLLQCFDNQLTQLTLGNANNIHSLYCQNNLLTNLDASNVTNLYNLNCSNNNLIQLGLRNNFVESSVDFSANPNLQYVCADEMQMSDIQNKITEYGYNNCFANTFCSFVPGNPVYGVAGLTRYDELTDGCDNTDIIFPGLQFTFSDGTNTANIYSNNSGVFNTASQSTTITITPQLANTTYFSVSPSSQTLSLTSTTTPLVQNFCVTPNGSHPDLEVTLIRTNVASNAYQYYYLLTYKNVGTNTQSGNVSLTFNDNQQDYLSSVPTAAASTNLLNWDFSDLKPFESRTIEIIFYMNFGTTLNEGDMLHYEATVSSSVIDETPNNNSFIIDEFYSTVVLDTPSLSFSDYFALYPNPVHDVLNLKVKNDILVKEVTVYNLLGQSVQQIKAVSNDSAIDISRLSKGTYIIKIVSDKGIFNSKFVKN